MHKCIACILGYILGYTLGTTVAEGPVPAVRVGKVLAAVVQGKASLVGQHWDQLVPAILRERGGGSNCIP